MDNIYDENSVSVEKESLDSIYAESVTLSNSAVKEINAGKVEMTQSAVVMLRGQSVEQKNCGNAIVKVKNLKTNSLKSLITVADHIEGDVATVLDNKGAAIFGLVFASVIMFFRLLRRLR